VTHSRPHLPPSLFLAIGVFCIGFSAIFVKWAGVAGPVSAFYRTLIAALVIVPWRLRQTRPLPDRRDLVWVALGGVFFACDLTLWNSSLLLTSAATAVLLANNAPLWVGLASFLLFRERLAGRYWLGLAVALGGMVVLVGADAALRLRFSLGDALALSSSFFYAAYLLTTRTVRARVDTVTFMAVSVAVSAFLLLALNLSLGSKLHGYPGRVWLSLLGLGLVSHLGGWLAINYALGHMRAAPLSVGLLGQAPVTALLAIPLLGEGLRANQVVGGLLVLFGIFLVNQRWRPAGRAGSNTVPTGEESRGSQSRPAQQHAGR